MTLRARSVVVCSLLCVAGLLAGCGPREVRGVKFKGQLLNSWVLVGDPLSTTINSRGDVSDTGASRAIRFDPASSWAELFRRLRAAR